MLRQLDALEDSGLLARRHLLQSQRPDMPLQPFEATPDKIPHLAERPRMLTLA